MKLKEWKPKKRLAIEIEEAEGTIYRIHLGDDEVVDLDLGGSHFVPVRNKLNVAIWQNKKRSGSDILSPLKQGSF